MKQPVSHDQDPDMVNSMAALIRASKRARKLAAETGTALVFEQNGELVWEYPQISKTAKRKKTST
ncbi:hypothetical protein BH10CYA1_BH10CYA1_59140 [soil metagenome]